MQDEPYRIVWARDMRRGQNPGEDWREFIVDGFFNHKTGERSRVVVAWRVPDPDWYISQLGDA